MAQVTAAGELLNGRAAGTGVEIASALLVDNPYSISGEAPKDFLDLSYNDGHYLFLWSTVGYQPETGVYGVRTSQYLENISIPTPIVATNRDTARGNLSEASQPTVVYLDGNALVLWPSRSGAVEGWFMDSNKIE